MARPRKAMFRGWQVVAAAFVVAICSWGINFYGPSVYLHALQAREGWPPALIAAAITLHFLASGAIVTRLPGLHRRFGLVAVTRAGLLACAAGAAAWGHAAAPWQMAAAALVTALGWALTSGVAINAMVAPWFDRRRGAALSMAFNGASMGGVLFAPLWAALIAAFGFARASLCIALPVAALGWWLAGQWFRDTPATLGLYPDGADTPPAPRPAAAPAGPLWRQARFRSLSLAFALGLLAQMGLLTVLFSLLAPVLGEAGAGLAMSLATGCAILGRTVVGLVLPAGLDRRLAGSANFLLQAAGCALLAAAGDAPALLLAGVVLFGLGIGNLLSLPPLIAQAEWPPEQVSAVLALVTAVNQAFYAFGPALFGAALQGWGAAAPPALAMALQAAAAGVLLRGQRRA
ncbi:MFS transporter [Paracraurococcus lichenis]|uniref:MFS transporter n=1 Tax=Paracraurococcus lichenis TaxID=3064888 RepID=A0ABT9DUJ0_9PROT|nr:MFS transporter [Paracraurococcus sp. LOR1-02]MDO9707567.1 MFS transporter [Paracraurococcus sp. LOR1-02]